MQQGQHYRHEAHLSIKLCELTYCYMFMNSDGPGHYSHAIIRDVNWQIVDNKIRAWYHFITNNSQGPRAVYVVVQR